MRLFAWLGSLVESNLLLFSTAMLSEPQWVAIMRSPVCISILSAKCFSIGFSGAGESCDYSTVPDILPLLSFKREIDVAAVCL